MPAAFRHDVFGVFMRNWDESEETGNANCTVEADYAQAQSVCRHIGVPLHEVNFVRQYWTHVFSDFVAQVSLPGKCMAHARSEMLLVGSRFLQVTGSDRELRGS